MNEAELEAAYNRGYQAFLEDAGIDDSSFTGRLREAWEQGWVDARDDEYEARKK